MTDLSQPARSLRLFVAVDVPPAVRAEVDAAAAELRAAAPSLRWSDPANWHLTVAFLGAVAPGQLGGVVHAIADAAANAAPLSLALTGRAGTFPGVIWTELEASAALSELVEDLRRRLEPLGYDDQRPFRAHLTLARSRRRNDRSLAKLAATYRGPTSAWTVEHLVLWRSQLQRGGARHEIVARFELGESSASEPPPRYSN